MTDFGLAKIQDVDALTHALTRTGVTGGTLYYMSPEQVEGLPNVDQRGDLYSLGMTFYEMLAGKSPFRGLSSEFAILKAIDAHDFPSLDELNKEIPLPLAQIIMKAVEREPEDRYQTAQAMYKAVEDWLNTPSEPALPKAASPRTAPSALEETFTQIQRLDEPLPLNSDTVDTSERKDSSHTVPLSTPPPSKTSPAAKTIVGGIQGPTTGATPPPDNDSVAKPEPRKRLLRRAGVTAIILVLGALVYLLVQQFTGEPSKTASMTLHTVPTAAFVLVNGQPAGNTPLTDVEVEAGDLALSIEMAGYISLDTVLAVASGETPAFRFALEADSTAVEPPAPDTTTIQEIALGSLSVTSNPSGARVFLNNRRRGQTPYTTNTLEAGTYQLVLRQAGHQDYETRVTIVPEQLKRVTGNLTALMGTLRVVVQPFGSIFINEDRKVTDRVTYDEVVPYGTYQVLAVHPTFGRWLKSVTLDQQTRDVLFNFNQEFTVQVISSPSNAEILVDGNEITLHHEHPRSRHLPARASSGGSSGL